MKISKLKTNKLIEKQCVFPKGEYIKDMVVFKNDLYIATSEAVYKITEVDKKLSLKEE